MANTLFLWKQKKRTDGRAPIYLRIIAQRKSRFKSSGIYIREKHWNPVRQEVRKSHELHQAYNAKLQDLYLRAERAALKADTVEGIKAVLEGSGGTVDGYLEQFIEKKKRRDQYWERKKYQTTLRKLRNALDRERITWKQLTPSALDALERHCLEDLGNNANTTRKELSRLRRVVKQAVREGILDANDDPFLRYTMPSKVPVEQRRLTREEMQAMEDVEVSGKVAFARDAFVFAFYAGGMRFGDVCQLRATDIHDGRLRYTMMKTDQQVDLPLPEAALNIVKRHVSDSELLFSFIRKRDKKDPVRLRKRISSANVQVNNRLKTVAELAEVREPKDVSFHVSRHSFADYARKCSSDLYAVSKALGHSSLQVTETYLSSFDRDATDRLANDMWE